MAARAAEAGRDYAAPQRILLDTNVIVAMLVARHPHHPLVQPWLARIRTGDVRPCVAAHSLAETYSALTRIGVAAAAAAHLIDAAVCTAWRSRVAGLEPHAYRTALTAAAARRVVGGRIHDAIIAATAVAERIPLLTLNAGDFAGLIDDPAMLIDLLAAD